MKKQERWTVKESRLLIDYYHYLSWEALQQVFPGRTYKELAKQIHYLEKVNT